MDFLFVSTYFKFYIRTVLLVLVHTGRTMCCVCGITCWNFCVPGAWGWSCHSNCSRIFRRCFISWIRWRSWNYVCYQTTMANILWVWRICCRNTHWWRLISMCWENVSRQWCNSPSASLTRRRRKDTDHVTLPLLWTVYSSLRLEHNARYKGRDYSASASEGKFLMFCQVV